MSNVSFWDTLAKNRRSTETHEATEKQHSTRMTLDVNESIKGVLPPALVVREKVMFSLCPSTGGYPTVSGPSFLTCSLVPGPVWGRGGIPVLSLVLSKVPS